MEHNPDRREQEGCDDQLGSGTLDTKASKSPGAAVPLVVAIATKNPLGLIVLLPRPVGAC
jgi:hypothetical protein